MASDREDAPVDRHRPGEGLQRVAVLRPRSRFADQGFGCGALRGHPPPPPEAGASEAAAPARRCAGEGSARGRACGRARAGPSGRGDRGGRDLPSAVPDAAPGRQGARLARPSAVFGYRTGMRTRTILLAWALAWPAAALAWPAAAMAQQPADPLAPLPDPPVHSPPQPVHAAPASSARPVPVMFTLPSQAAPAPSSPAPAAPPARALP